MEKIFVGCALSDVNRADLPNGLRAPERLADYVQRFEKAVGADSFSFELQPEDAWVLPCEFPDQFIERKTNRWWRASIALGRGRDWPSFAPSSGAPPAAISSKASRG